MTKVGEVDLNNYKDIVLAALKEAVEHELLGSYGNEEAGKLLNMLKYEKYCVENEIDYKNMTHEDFVKAYLDSVEI